MPAACRVVQRCAATPPACCQGCTGNDKRTHDVDVALVGGDVKRCERVVGRCVDGGHVIDRCHANTTTATHTPAMHTTYISCRTLYQQPHDVDVAVQRRVVHWGASIITACMQHRIRCNERSRDLHVPAQRCKVQRCVLRVVDGVN